MEELSKKVKEVKIDLNYKVKLNHNDELSDGFISDLRRHLYKLREDKKKLEESLRMKRRTTVVN